MRGRQFLIIKHTLALTLSCLFLLKCRRSPCLSSERKRLSNFLYSLVEWCWCGVLGPSGESAKSAGGCTILARSSTTIASSEPAKAVTISTSLPQWWQWTYCQKINKVNVVYKGMALNEPVGQILHRLHCKIPSQTRAKRNAGIRWKWPSDVSPAMDRDVSLTGTTGRELLSSVADTRTDWFSWLGPQGLVALGLSQ